MTGGGLIPTHQNGDDLGMVGIAHWVHHNTFLPIGFHLVENGFPTMAYHSPQ
jgi:hypothetical protein